MVEPLNREMAYRIQMMPANVRSNAWRVSGQLMRAGFSKEAVEQDLQAALAWANSHCIVQSQAKSRRTREQKKQQVSSDDALDAMFAAAGADPSLIPVRKDFVDKTNGTAAGLMAARTEGQTKMALGLNYSSGGGSGEIVPFVKYDARAGRLFRRDRTQGSDGNYISNDVDVTNNFKAVFDMENVEVGYLKFGAGAAPEHLLVRLGDPMPHKPADPGFKQGARLMMKLAANCGGDIREITGNSTAFLKGIDELHTAYEAGKAANAGKLPIVTLQSTLPITSGSGQKKSTNYQPVFEITGWAPRPNDLIFAPKNNTQQIASPSSAPAAPLSTGSTQVAPPSAKQLETAGADDFG